MSITQKDVAGRLGISQRAVAFALSDSLHARKQLRAETRHRILETAQQMGYVPHHAARRLARTRSDRRTTSFDQIGMIYLADSHLDLDTVCLAMMGGAEHELSELHASLTFVRVREEPGWAKVERLTRAGGVDGWLLYGAVNDEVVNRLKPGKLPYVILGDHRCARPVHSVNVDHEAVARLAVEHLASLGHRRIGFFGGGTRHVYEEQTLAGFHAAIDEEGLDGDERLISSGSLWDRWDHQAEFWSPANSELVLEWLRNAGPMPTALFTPEFDWADGICRVLRQAQIEVPKQISILGYEPVSHAARTQNFTRIELPMMEVGRQGALLLHRIASKQPMESAELKISPSLIEGWSTCPPGGSQSRPAN